MSQVFLDDGREFNVDPTDFQSLTRKLSQNRRDGALRKFAW